MNILYINHYAGSIYHGMEYRPYYLAREWVKLGHNVTIIASNFSHIRNKNTEMDTPDNYLTEPIDGINYIWCKTPAYPENGIKRVINIFVFLYRVRKLMPKLIKKAKPDLVIASSTYPFDTKIAAQVAKKTGAKFVYEVHDLWPLTPMELGGMSKHHPFIWLMQKAEDFGYKNADKVVSLLPKADQYMQQHGMAPEKFVYIPNGVSIDEWQNSQDKMPLEHNKHIAQLKSKYKFLIGYAGGMGESNALDYLLSAASKVIDQDVAFILLGNGANRSKLLARIKEEHIINVYFLPEIKKTQVADFLSYMDALYIGWNKLSIYRFGICPNKLFDYMLASKPIIHSVTAGNDLVIEANCGISVPAEDITGIINAILLLTTMNKQQLEHLGQNGYNYVFKNHDYKVLAQQFLEKVSGK